MAAKLSNSIQIALVLALILAGGVVEHYSVTGVYAGCVYVMAVLFTLLSQSKFNVIVATSVACLTVLFSVFYIHAHEDLYTVSVNHIFSLLGILVAMFFVLYVKNIQDKAEEDNKQVNSLIQHATEGIILTNRSGEIVLVNPYAENLFGYYKDELIGKKIEQLIPEEVGKKHIRYRDGFHNRPVNRSMGAGRDLFAKRKDGSVFPVEVSLSHYMVGRESFVIAFIIDITIRKNNEEILRRQTEQLEKISEDVKHMNQELEQKVEDRTMMLRETLAQLERSKDELAWALEKEKELSDLKSRFVSTVSHEFRTPLSAIISSASLLARYVNADEQDKRDRHIIRVKESAQHMNGMLEDLLSLGRLDEGLVIASKETFDLRKFMGELVADMTEMAKPGQKIMHVPVGEFLVNTDKRLLKNVLINLVGNAIKFSPENSEIWISSFNENGELKISVQDSGMGISEEDQMHLFERFFRARNALNVQGTGLGLHIVSKYLELLNGSISLRSKLGEGSTFTILIKYS